MKVKKFEAKDVSEALFKIRAELGGDAVILQTRKINKGGIFGFFGRELTEVLAATDLNVSDNTSFKEVSEKINSLQEEVREIKKVVQEEMKEMKNFSHTLYKQMSAKENFVFPPPLQDTYLQLLKNEVEEKLARNLVSQVQEEINKQSKLPSPILIYSTLKEIIAQLIGDAVPILLEPDRCKVIALIGPTGVGKTTTIAKIAAQFSLMEGKKVAFITTDTHRLAAKDQLIIYASIMEMPIEVVLEPKDFRQALAKHADKDLILIDTAGKSQNNTNRLYELKNFYEAGHPDEVHLVLSANIKCLDLLDVIEKFSIVPFNKILFTKLDETTNFGGLLNVKIKTDLPISYVTTGQEVPEDIELPDKEKLSAKIIGVYNNG